MSNKAGRRWSLWGSLSLLPSLQIKPVFYDLFRNNFISCPIIRCLKYFFVSLKLKNIKYISDELIPAVYVGNKPQKSWDDFCFFWLEWSRAVRRCRSDQFKHADLRWERRLAPSAPGSQRKENSHQNTNRRRPVGSDSGSFSAEKNLDQQNNVNCNNE